MAGQQVIVSQATRRGVSPASPAMASHEVKHAISPVPIESRAGKYRHVRPVWRKVKKDDRASAVRKLEDAIRTITGPPYP